MKTKLFLLLFCYLTLSVFSQNLKLTDSLQNLAKVAKDDTSKSNLLNKISTTYLEIDLEKSLDFAKRSLALSEKLNYKKGIANAYFSLGNISNYKAEYLEAINWFKRSLSIRKELFLMSDVGQTYSSIGYCYEDMGNFSEAKKNYFASLKIREQLKDKIGIAKCNANIGNVYYQNQNLTEGLKYLLPALKVFEAAGEKRMIAAVSHNIGTIYMYQGKPEAMTFLQAALKNNEEMGNRFWKTSNLGSMSELYRKQGNYTEAEKCLKRAFKILEESGQKEGMINIYNLLAKLNMSQKKYNEARLNLNKALELATLSNSITRRQICYASLAELEQEQGNYKKALDCYKLSIILRDSVFSKENIKKMTQQQMQYDFDKKETLTKEAQEKKDIIIQNEIQSQKNLRNGFIGGFILVLLAASLFFFQRNKINKEKKRSDQLLHLVEEKHKEITDSINYAERIQRSFIATEEILATNLKDHFVFFKPKAIVSGDFYWAGKLSNGNFVLATADSTGHGVPGAIMSLLNITSLESAIKDGFTHPSAILNDTRKTIIERLKKDGSAEGGKDGMDGSLISFDFKNNKFTYSAANNPVWVVRENQIVELDPDKMPIGKHDKDHISFTQHEFDLQKNDVVYTLTDGMPDQFGGPKGKKFMYKKLKELLVSIANLSMNEQKTILLNSLNEWKGNLEQVDDITLIGVRV
ncbi:MAG: tetratricopeptide repeat protein [Bacteroidetes bacterium]|nr:tetratricopeptide repeat protein [Bacteroidota bacterium]